MELLDHLNGTAGRFDLRLGACADTMHFQLERDLQLAATQHFDGVT